MSTLTDLALRYLGEYGNEPEEEEDEPPPILTPPTSNRRKHDDYVGQLIQSNIRQAQTQKERVIASTVPETLATADIPTPVSPSSYSGFASRLAEAEEAQTTTARQSTEGVLGAATTLGTGLVGLIPASFEVFQQTLDSMKPEFVRRLAGLPPQAPPFSFKAIEEAFQYPQQFAYQPRSVTGQAVESAILSPITALNEAARFVANQSRKIGVSEDTAKGIELALGLIGISELVGGGKAIRGKAARLRVALRKGNVDEAGRVAADIANDPNTTEIKDILRRTWVPTPEYPTMEAFENRRAAAPVTPAPDTGLADISAFSPTPEIPPPPAQVKRGRKRAPVKPVEQPVGLLTPDELAETISRLNTLSPDEIREANILSPIELNRRATVAADALEAAVKSGQTVSQISDAGLQDRAGLYFNLVQRYLAQKERTTRPQVKPAEQPAVETPTQTEAVTPTPETGETTPEITPEKLPVYGKNTPLNETTYQQALNTAPVEGWLDESTDPVRRLQVINSMVNQYGFSNNDAKILLDRWIYEGKSKLPYEKDILGNDIRRWPSFEVIPTQFETAPLIEVKPRAEAAPTTEATTPTPEMRETIRVDEIRGVIGSMGRGISEALRDMLWNQYQKNEVRSTAGNVELSLQVSRALKTNNIDITREEFNTIVDEVDSLKTSLQEAKSSPEQFNAGFLQYLRDKQTELQTARKPTPETGGTTRTVENVPIIEEQRTANDVPRWLEELAIPEGRQAVLADLKSVLREGKKGKVDYAQALRDMGFTQEEAASIAPELSAIKAARKTRTPEPTTEQSISNVPTPDVTSDPLYQTALRELNTDPTMTDAQLAATMGVSLQEANRLRTAAMPNVTPAEPKPVRQRKKRAPKPAEAPPPLMYKGVPDLANLNSTLSRQNQTGNVDSPDRVNGPISIGYEKSTPRSVHIDTTGLNSVESAADVQRQIDDGTITRNQGMNKLARLAEKARVAGVPVNEAHLVNSADIPNNVIRLAHERGLDVYVKQGDQYVKVPREVVSAEAKLNSGDVTQPSNLTSEERDAYLEAHTPDVPDDMLTLIQDSIEQGIDISDSLPSNLAEMYRNIFNENRRSMNTSEIGAFTRILNDVNNLTNESGEGGYIGRVPGLPRPPLSGERGSIGRYGLTSSQKLSAQNLQADAIKRGETLRYYLEKIRNLPPATISIIESYLETVNNPPPPSGLTPSDMTITKTPSKLVMQRKMKNGSTKPPIYEDDLRPMQQASFKKRRIVWGEPIIYTLRKYGLEDLMYRYRDAYRSAEFEKRESRRQFADLEKNSTLQERRNVAAWMYQFDPDGVRINNENGITPPSALTPNEAMIEQSLRTMFDNYLDRMNAVRAITGQDPISKIPNYLTLMRKFTAAEQWGFKPSLLTTPSSTLNTQLGKYSTTAFPYTKRKHAKYNAEYNVTKIAETYLNAAIDEIHLTPFTTKLKELTNTKFRNLDNPKRVWQLKNANQSLYEALRGWNDAMLGIPNIRMDAILTSTKGGRFFNKFLNAVSRNVALSHISYAVGSVLNQTGVVVNTMSEIGVANTMNGLRLVLSNPTPFGKAWKDSMKRSRVLDTRAFDVAQRNLFNSYARFDPTSPIAGIANIGTKAITYTDLIMAQAAWHGADRMYQRKGMSPEKAANLADDVVVRTQGSSTPGDLSSIQRSTLGRTASSLQTFAINQFYSFLNDTMGIGQGRSVIVNSWNVTKWLAYSAIYGSIMYHLFNMENAQPDPIGAFIEGMDDNIGVALGMAGLEAVQFIPGIGGALKYQKGLGGPVGNLFQDFSREPIEGLRITGLPRTAIELMKGKSPYEATMRGQKRERRKRTGPMM